MIQVNRAPHARTQAWNGSRDSGGHFHWTLRWRKPCGRGIPVRIHATKWNSP